METPENNVKFAALKLLRFKAISQKPKTLKDWVLELEDVNEILTVAGMPVIMPGEIDKKEVEVIV